MLIAISCSSSSLSSIKDSVDNNIRTLWEGGRRQGQRRIRRVTAGNTNLINPSSSNTTTGLIKNISAASMTLLFLAIMSAIAVGNTVGRCSGSRFVASAFAMTASNESTWHKIHKRVGVGGGIRRRTVSLSSRTGRGRMFMWGEGPSSQQNHDPSSPPSSSSSSYHSKSTPPRISNEKSESKISIDEEGRRIRGGGGGGGSLGKKRTSPPKAVSRNQRSTEHQRGRGWDDFRPNDDLYDDEVSGYEPYEYSSTKSQRSRKGGGGERAGQRGGYGGVENTRQKVKRGSGGDRDWKPGGRKFAGSNYNAHLRYRNDDDNETYPRRSAFKSKSDRFPKQQQQQRRDNQSSDVGKINLRALEDAGFEHLYGLAPILNALASNRRDFTSPFDERDDYDEDESSRLVDDQEDNEHELMPHQASRRTIKPEAQPAPCLFIQERTRAGGMGRRDMDKALAAEEVMTLTEQRGVKVARVDKGVLNTLCNNRPHQGYVLRCGGLSFEPMSRIPHPKSVPGSPALWLVLDEVVDPQNFGALLRSAYFLGGAAIPQPYDNEQNHDKHILSAGSIGVMVCAKNSAPPSPVVSAASAGALELCQVYSTSNLPRTLNAAREDGWRILGAAASSPAGVIDELTGQPVVCRDLRDVDIQRDQPSILVLGSEGHGLRTLVAKACTDFVRIGGGAEAETGGDERDRSPLGVDSLNVSVSGGIMLWHLINAMRK